MVVSSINDSAIGANASNLTQNYGHYAGYSEAVISRILRWTLLSLILLLGVAGNSAVCFVAYRNKRMKNFSYILITNLAVADLLSAVVGIPVYILNNYYQTWTLGLVMCKLLKPTFPLFNIVVTNSLVAIACERFRGLVYPLSIKPGTTKTRLVLSILWLIALFCALPAFGATAIKTWEGYDVKVCTEIFHEDEVKNRLYFKVYSTFLFLLNNLFPLLIILFLYVKITATLKRISLLPVAMRMLRRSSSDASTPAGTPRHSWNLANANQAAFNRRQLVEKKFIRMLMVVVLVFVVCYVPYQIFFLVAEYHPEIVQRPELFTYYLAPYLYVLMWAPVALNPICYGSMNERYKNAFRALIRCSKEQKLDRLRRKLSSIQTFLNPTSPGSERKLAAV